MEERVGERRRVGFFASPLSSVLSPLLRRGERKKSNFSHSDLFRISIFGFGGGLLL